MIGTYLTDRVTIESVTRDGFGDVNGRVSTPNVPARVEHNDFVINDANGQRIESQTQVLMRVGAVTDKDSLIVIDDTEYTILQIQRPKDFSERFIRLILR